MKNDLGLGIDLRLLIMFIWYLWSVCQNNHTILKFKFVNLDIGRHIRNVQFLIWSMAGVLNIAKFKYSLHKCIETALHQK